MLKINYVAIVAGIIALASLFLPWFVVNLNLTTTETEVKFTAYLYQIVGASNGVSQTTPISIWFGWAVIAFMIIAAVCAFAGSFLAGKKGKLLIYITGILAILSIVVFAVGLFTSDFTGKEGFEYTLSYFTNNLGLSNEQLDSNRTSVWSIDTIGYGVWLALVAAIVAFAAIIIHNVGKVPSQ